MQVNLKKEYEERRAKALEPAAVALTDYIMDIVSVMPRIDRVSVRAKSVTKFLQKADKESVDGKKYTDPINQIQDQLGARIVTFYECDIDRIRNRVGDYFRGIEEIVKMPDSQWKFGYFGVHYILFIPDDVRCKVDCPDLLPTFFELQIKTLFQHAWAEAHHDLGYKPEEGPLNPDQERQLAFAAAQAWGADRVFDDLFRNVGMGKKTY